MKHIKIVLVGLSGAGKTTILKRLCNNPLVASDTVRSPTSTEIKAWGVSDAQPVSTTLYCNYGTVLLKEEVNGELQILQNGIRTVPDYSVMIVDTVGYAADDTHDVVHIGNERFRYESMELVDGILFVIDSSLDYSDPEHPQKFLKAYNDLEEFFAKTYKHLPIPVFVCNKQDLMQQKLAVAGSVGRKVFCGSILRSHNQLFQHVQFFNASAERNWGVEDAFKHLVRLIVKSRIETERERESKICPIRQAHSAIINNLEKMFGEKIQEQK